MGGTKIQNVSGHGNVAAAEHTNAILEAIQHEHTTTRARMAMILGDFNGDPTDFTKLGPLKTTPLDTHLEFIKDSSITTDL